LTVTRQICSRIDVKTHDGDSYFALDNPVTLSSDPVTSGSMHTQRLTCIVSLLSFVLMDQAACILEHEQTHSQTDTHTDRRN